MGVAVLLYRSESWVIPPSVLKVLPGFYVKTARRLTGMHQQRVRGMCVQSKAADILAATRLHPIEYCIAKRMMMVLKAIKGRTLLEECWGTERQRGSPARQYW